MLQILERIYIYLYLWPCVAVLCDPVRQSFKWIGQRRALSKLNTVRLWSVLWLKPSIMHKCAEVTCCLIYFGATFHRSGDEAVCDRWTDIVPFPIPRVNPSLYCFLTDAEGGTGPTSLSSHWFGCLNSHGWRAWLWGLVFPAGQGGKIRVMQIRVMLSGLMLIVLQSNSYTQKLSKHNVLEWRQEKALMVA